MSVNRKKIVSPGRDDTEESDVEANASSSASQKSVPPLSSRSPHPPHPHPHSHSSDDVDHHEGGIDGEVSRSSNNNTAHAHAMHSPPTSTPRPPSPAFNTTSFVLRAVSGLAIFALILFMIMAALTLHRRNQLQAEHDALIQAEASTSSQSVITDGSHPSSSSSSSSGHDDDDASSSSSSSISAWRSLWGGGPSAEETRLQARVHALSTALQEERARERRLVEKMRDIVDKISPIFGPKSKSKQFFLQAVEELKEIVNHPSDSSESSAEEHEESHQYGGPEHGADSMHKHPPTDHSESNTHRHEHEIELDHHHHTDSDEALAKLKEAEAHHDHSFLPAIPPAVFVNSSDYPAYLDVKISLPDLTTKQRMNISKCHDLRREYLVQPGRDWGNLPKNLQEVWASYLCDSLLSQEDKIARAKWYQIRKDRETPPSPLPPRFHHKKQDQEADSEEEEAEEEENSIAICICSTTRNVYDLTSLNQLTLFSSLLPSMLSTLEYGYEYRVYVVYDQGDLFYDRDGMETHIYGWFDLHISQPLSVQNISVSLKILRFDNTERKPGPAFNYLLQHAYDDGAHYLYRINDDSIFETKWASHFVQVLKSMSPPFLGVVGPNCHVGNTHILTHDFTHRTHMDIFYPFYYPVILSDWWMDDWITRVYGRRRTVKANTVIMGHSGLLGTRYEVNPEHKDRLQHEIQFGREKIVNYMKKNNMPANLIASYENDVFDFHV